MRNLAVVAVLGVVSAAACSTTPPAPAPAAVAAEGSGLEKVTIVSLGME